MRLKKIALGACLCLYLSCFYPPLASFADTVVLKSGQVVEGKIIENTGKLVKIDFNGVELTYFQEEVASVNLSDVDNATRNELASLYEAFNSSKKVVENKNQLVGSAKPVESAQPTFNTNSISLSKTAGDIDTSAIVQEVISKLPKEYQDMVKSELQNMQVPSSTSQVSGIIPAGLSSLPPEYQDMVKSTLETLKANAQEVKK